MWTPINRIIAYGVAFNSLRMLVGAISAIYLLSKGLSLSDIGLLKTLQAGVILFLDIPLAYFADRYSRKLSVTLSVLFSAIWLLLTGLATTKYQFYVAEIFNAISIAMISGALISYLIDFGGKSGSSSGIHKVVGRYQKYQYLSMGISAFIGAAFVKVNSSIIWIISSALCIVLFVGFSWALPKDKIHSNLASSKRSIKSDVSSVIFTFKNDQGILIIMSLTMLVVSLFYQVLIQYWQPLSFSGFAVYPDAGILYGVIFAVILLSQSGAGWLSSKIDDTRKLLFLGLFTSVLALGLSLISFYFYSLAMILSVVLMFFSNRLTSIALTGFFHSRISSELRATLDSVVSTLLRLVLLLVMPLIGILIDGFGWWIFFIFYGAIVLFTISISIFQSQYKRPK